MAALLEGGADPNLPSGKGAAPIHHALYELRGASTRGSFGDPDSGAGVAAAFVTAHLKTLSEHGADVDRPTPRGDAPLALVASLTECPDGVLDALLDAGATARGVHITTDGERVDLLAACMFSDLSEHIAKRLVDAGCTWDVSYEPFGDRPFIAVVQQFRPELALALANHHDAFAEAMVTYRGVDGFNTLAIASVSGHEPLMKWLLERGVRPDEAGGDGRTAIDIARVNCPELVEMLEAAGS